MTVGHQHGETLTALARLGIGPESLGDLGIRLLNVRQPFPLDVRTVREFASGLDEILVVEDKRPFVERMVKESLYGTADQPRVVGKADERGQHLLPTAGAIDADTLLPPLRSRLAQRITESRMRPLSRPRPMLQIIDARRAPYFCSGCPHNRSTRVPDGALVGGGIGCHGMSQFMEPEITGGVASTTHMGSEGAQWIGIAPFVETDHMFQNIGDGTYFHSGQLAVQASVAAGSHITYKLLFNDAIAMTGGQDPAESNALSVPRVCESLLAQGVRRIIVTTDDTHRYRRVRLPRNVDVWDRDRLIEAQEALAATEGVTVLIHDQRCAAENRRDRKRGKIATPKQRIVINERVCEGCGDCGVQSNCLSVEPVETEFGRKTRINQDSCNLDFSCLQGDCPSFMTVTLPKRSTTRRQGPDDDLSAVLSQPIPEPELPSTADGFVIRIPGIGGTGVVTTSQIISTAARLDGRHTVGLDQTGLSQKAGPVVSDLTISDSLRIASNKAAAGTVDLLLGLDILGSGTEMTLASTAPDRSVAVVSTTRTPTGRMVSDVSAPWPETASFERGLEERLGRGRVHWVDAEQVARDLFGSASVLNLFMVGAAFQLAALPVSAASLERAIALNGVAVQANIDAFRAGRLWVCNRAALAPRLSDETPFADSANAVAAIPIPALDHDPRVRELAEARSAEPREVPKSCLRPTLRRRRDACRARRDTGIARIHCLHRGNRPRAVQGDGVQGRVRGGASEPRPAGEARHRGAVRTRCHSPVATPPAHSSRHGHGPKTQPRPVVHARLLAAAPDAKATRDPLRPVRIHGAEATRTSPRRRVRRTGPEPLEPRRRHLTQRGRGDRRPARHGPRLRVDQGTQRRVVPRRGRRSTAAVRRARSAGSG